MQPTSNARDDTDRDHPPDDIDRGGESACYAHLVCTECGAVLDGGRHAPRCSRSDED